MEKGRSPRLAPGPFLCLLLIGCGASTSPSSQDARELDNAEAMLNSAASELSNIDSSEIEGANRNSPGPR